MLTGIKLFDMRFNVLTIFPEIFNVLEYGVISKTFDNNNSIKCYDIRKNAINKQDLPDLDNNEAYWFELIDMEVIDKESGDLLGKVSSLNNFGAQDCLEINPTKLSVDDEKRLIPFIRDEFIQSIEREKNIIYVNWDKTF